MPITCSCRTFAVGYCADCGQPVCEQHSSTRMGSRLCLSCEEGRTPAGRERRNEAERRAAREHDERLGRVAAIEDPIERLISAVRFVLEDLAGLHPRDRHAPDSAPGDCPDIEGRRVRMREELTALCPELCGGVDSEVFPSKLDWIGAWDSGEVGRWFVGQAANADLQPDGEWYENEHRKRRLFGPSVVHVATHRGWKILNYKRMSPPASMRAILSDGRVCALPNACIIDGPPKRQELELRHLAALAVLLELPSGIEIARSYSI